MEVGNLFVAGLQIEHIMYQLQTEDKSDQIKKMRTKTYLEYHRVKRREHLSDSSVLSVLLIGREKSSLDELPGQCRIGQGRIILGHFDVKVNRVTYRRCIVRRNCRCLPSIFCQRFRI